MCAIDDAEPLEVSHQQQRRARKAWACGECRRTIQPGELYRYLTGRVYSDNEWLEFRWCRHCHAAGEWMGEVCGGYPREMLLEELREHWEEGYRSIPFARLIVGVKHGWHDGRDPEPVGVRELAKAMLAAQVDEGVAS